MTETTTTDDEMNVPAITANVSIETIDLTRGYMTYTIDIGETTTRTECYIPDLLGWTTAGDSDTETTTVPMDTVQTIGETLEDTVADRRGVDADDVVIHALQAPNEVEYSLTAGRRSSDD